MKHFLILLLLATSCKTEQRIEAVQDIFKCQSLCEDYNKSLCQVDCNASDFKCYNACMTIQDMCYDNCFMSFMHEADL